jgi:hypothetical protein
VPTDSPCYAAAVIAAVRRNGTRYSVTAPGANVAETSYTAFTSKKALHVTARLIVHRAVVTPLAPNPAPANLPDASVAAIRPREKSGLISARTGHYA